MRSCAGINTVLKLKCPNTVICNDKNEQFVIHLHGKSMDYYANSNYVMELCYGIQVNDMA